MKCAGCGGFARGSIPGGLRCLGLAAIAVGEGPGSVKDKANRDKITVTPHSVCRREPAGLNLWTDSLRDAGDWFAQLPVRSGLVFTASVRKIPRASDDFAVKLHLQYKGNYL